MVPGSNPPLRNAAERDAEADLLAYQKADPKNVGLLGRISHDILNILEDGYIENRMLMDYPGILGQQSAGVAQGQTRRFSYH